MPVCSELVSHWTSISAAGARDVHRARWIRAHFLAPVTPRRINNRFPGFDGRTEHIPRRWRISPRFLDRCSSFRMPELVDVAEYAAGAVRSSKQFVYAVNINLTHGFCGHEVTNGEIRPEETELI